MAKQRSEMNPFVSLDVRVFAEAQDPYEMAYALAMVFWYWVMDENEELGVEGIAAMGRMSISKAKEVTAKFKKRGWLDTKRRFGGKTAFALTVPKMTHIEALTRFTAALPEDLRNRVKTAYMKQMDSGQWAGMVYASNGQMVDPEELEAYEAQLAAEKLIRRDQRAARKPSISRQEDETGPPESSPNIKRSEEDQKIQSMPTLAFRDMENLFRDGWREFYAGEDYSVTGLDRKRLKELRDANPPIKKEVWVGRMAGYFKGADNWTKERKHPLWNYCQTFNQWSISTLKPKQNEEYGGLA